MRLVNRRGIRLVPNLDSLEIRHLLAYSTLADPILGEVKASPESPAPYGAYSLISDSSGPATSFSPLSYQAFLEDYPKITTNTPDLRATSTAVTIDTSTLQGGGYGLDSRASTIYAPLGTVLSGSFELGTRSSNRQVGSELLLNIHPSPGEKIGDPIKVGFDYGPHAGMEESNGDFDPEKLTYQFQGQVDFLLKNNGTILKRISEPLSDFNSFLGITYFDAKIGDSFHISYHVTGSYKITVDASSTASARFDVVSGGGLLGVYALVKPDLVANPLKWNTSGNGIDASYNINSADIPTVSRLGFYWSSDDKFDLGDTLDYNTFTQTAKSATPYSVYVDRSLLTTPPPGANFLLEVADPENTIDESSETNNVQAIELADIAIQAAKPDGPTSVTFQYTTMGDPGPFKVGLYRSVDGKTFDPADLITSQTVIPSLANPQAPGKFILPSPLVADSFHPYFVVVVDPWDDQHPAGLIYETEEEKNNVAVVTHTPLLLLPGIAGTFPAYGSFRNWLLNRGVSPEILRTDPLGNVYSDLIQTLKNAGYQEGKDLFVANYDWRVAPAPAYDGQADGRIGGLTAMGLMQGISASQPVFRSGVDYLAYWMKKASDAWAALHGNDPLPAVDIIAHSTGGLIVRAYIQSAAYNDVYGQDSNGHDLRLPKVDNFVMLDVPNQGASKAWNPIHDNFSIDWRYKYVLSTFINEAFKKLKSGDTIHGPDADITLGMVTRPNGTFDYAKFVSLYVPTLRSLLPTYAFGTNFAPDPADDNTLLLDLNAGSSRDGFVDKVGKVYDVYGNDVLTPVSVTRGVGDGIHGPRVFSFTDVIRGDIPGDGVVYYVDNEDFNGDGTVPLASLKGLFQGDDRVKIQEFIRGIQTSLAVGHTEIVSNPQAEQAILGDLGYSLDLSYISSGHGAGFSNLARILIAAYDPVYGVLTDSEGRRLGYTVATGPLAEIPNSVYVGEADGIGFVLGPVVGPLRLDLAGIGGAYSVQVGGVQDEGVADLSASGSLAAGELKSFAVMFAPLSTVTNNPPTLAAIDGRSVAEGSLLKAVVMATDPDAGQVLTYSLDPGAPGGASIDPKTGILSWVPIQGPGIYPITVRVTDDGSPQLSGSQAVFITVLNVPPTVMAGVNSIVVQGATLNQIGRFNDPGVSETFTATIDYGDGTGAHPLALDPDRTFAIDHAYARPGIFTVTATVIDQYAGIGTGTFTVQVAALPVTTPPANPVTITPPPTIDPLTFDPVALGRHALVTRLYRDVLGRVPDGPGFLHWMGRLAAGVEPANLVRGFFQSPERIELERHHKAPHLGQNTVLMGAVLAARNAAIVGTFYHEVLGRNPEHSGFQFWVGLLSSGSSITKVANLFYRSVEYRDLRHRHLDPGVGVKVTVHDAQRNATLVSGGGRSDSHHGVRA